MPSKSPAQHRLMEAVAHNPDFARKVGIPQSVGQEYSHADHLRDMKRHARSAPAGKPKR